jgi:murein DD-endopeptidase MepM/ murein hydrolase activator NlpD
MDGASAGGSAASSRTNVPVFGQSPLLSAIAAQPEAGPQVWQSLVAIENGIAHAQQVLGGVEAGTEASDAGPRTSDVVARARQLEVVSLAGERSFYVSVAGDPLASSQLLAAGSATRDADAVAVINVDLALVRAEMAKQNAVGAAERALASVGSLGPTQLAAIAARAPFIAPVLGPVAQPFGPTTLSIEPPAVEQGVSYPHFHTGLDIAAPLDSPIHAAADGTVLLAGTDTDDQGHLVGYGLYVVIVHPQGFVTLYGHLSSLSVHAGDAVRQGQIIGFEGSTGNSTGPHLHFEVRAAGNAVDPAPYVGSQLGS